MRALALFDWAATRTEPNEQHLERVQGRIGAAVLSFCRDCLHRNAGRFHASDLHAWVEAECGAAPASADRILRALRQQGAVSYLVESRRESRYLLRNVEEGWADGLVR